MLYTMVVNRSENTSDELQSSRADRIIKLEDGAAALFAWFPQTNPNPGLPLWIMAPSPVRILTASDSSVQPYVISVSGFLTSADPSVFCPTTSFSPGKNQLHLHAS